MYQEEAITLLKGMPADQVVKVKAREKWEPREYYGIPQTDIDGIPWSQSPIPAPSSPRLLLDYTTPVRRVRVSFRTVRAAKAVAFEISARGGSVSMQGPAHEVARALESF
jgi:hypothetical protein